jgi:6-pyruvoyl-tetrahydropterin synthase
MPRYHRIVNFCASHFNGELEYKMLKQAVADGTMQRDWPQIFLGVHGHDFKAEITVDGPLNVHGFVIADEDIDEVIVEFKDVNVSLIERFASNNLRATTELIAVAICREILDRLGPHSRSHVRLWEGDRYAESEASK